MSKSHQISYRGLLSFIEDSFTSLTYNPKQPIRINRSFCKTIIDCLDFYDCSIRNNRHWPDLQRISITDYRIYCCVIRRRCKLLMEEYALRRWCGDALRKEAYIDDLEHAIFIINNHFIQNNVCH